MTDLSPQRADILVVDDSPVALRLLCHTLRQHGFLVRSAATGEDAISAVRMLPPDLILMDVNMPGMNGFTACRHIKADPVSRVIPVIFLTASTGEADILEGFASGAADYVTKPFRETELLARVRTHLELKQHRDESDRLIHDLREALEQVKTLTGLLPICSHCHKVRDDAGYWADVETYLMRHTQTRFSHGICPDCLPMVFPELSGSSPEPPAKGS